MRLWTEGWGSLHAVSSPSVRSSEGTQSGRKMDPEVIWNVRQRGCRNVSGWEPRGEDVTRSDLKQRCGKTPTGTVRAWFGAELQRQTQRLGQHAWLDPTSHAPPCRCWGSTGLGGPCHPRRRRWRDAQATTWHRTHNQRCPQKNTGVCCAERQTERGGGVISGGVFEWHGVEKALYIKTEGARDYRRWHTTDRQKRETEWKGVKRGNECASDRAALPQPWGLSGLQSLIKKPCTLTQRHKTAGRDEREGPSIRCTVTSTQQLSARWEEIGGADSGTGRRGAPSGT